MKIQLKAQYVGPRGFFPPGTVIDVPDEEGTALVNGGYAFQVDEKPAKPAPAIHAPVAVETTVETADLPEPEKAVSRRRKPKDGAK